MTIKKVVPFKILKKFLRKNMKFKLPPLDYFLNTNDPLDNVIVYYYITKSTLTVF